ncbi:DNA-directed RNA polymerase subunit B [Candidatus Woesearchaeota archaeon]|nr:DNA-directed RNA polymerase subunit B [Candidatus Woesearchaeota archaeon]
MKMNEVYLNNKFVGKVDEGEAFVENFKDQRRKGLVSKNVNIFYNPEVKEIHIHSVEGRAQRPLIVVKEGKSLLTETHGKQLEDGVLSWSDLVRQGVIEYLDASEEENALVAYDEKNLTEDYTHLEISPMVICGLAATLVPFGNFNQSSRLIIGSKNQKQSIGFYAANYHMRMDMDTNLLHYPQFPIVKTGTHDIFSYEKNPAGQNVVVAIMCYDGYNMEDGVVLNKASIERGMSRSTYYRPTGSVELRYAGGLTDEISVPEKDVKGYRSENDYRFLEEDGIIYPEAKVKEGQVVIGKTSPPRFLSSLDEYKLGAATRRESSIALKHGESGIADFVLLTEGEDGNKLVQVRLRDERIPEIGDKFTSRHGQKGVVGILVPQGDLPFSASGIVPDLIFSPHGIPSRMTISHLIELVGGKVGSLAGRFVDGTIFEGEPEDKLRKELRGLGFREDGTEVFYDGKTGKQLKARIFVGNMYYLRLKHMVANKIHSRARGPVQLLTRQPTEGKAKEGGLRLGEMEKDTFVAHGASLLLKERFDSDKTILPICTKCGLVAVEDRYKNRKYCLVCGDDVEMSYIELSYAFKLLLDEFRSLGIYSQISLKNKY